MKKTNNKNIRADVVGSLLRPKFLLKAQKQIKQGKISWLEFVKAEDRAVKQAVTIQEKTNLDILTDGEMRRPVFCHNFVKAVTGFKWNIPKNTVIWFDMKGNKIIDPVTVGVVSKIKQVHDISVDEFAFLRSLTNKPTKITLPSPTMMSYFFVPKVSTKTYPNPIHFLDDVTKILKQTVTTLEKQGATHIQIDAPEFGMLIDPIQQQWFTAKGFKPETLIKQGVDMINHVLSDFSGTKSLHICRGNDKNRFMATGGYEKIAPIVFQKLEVNRLLLEFDSNRAGDFTPLKHVPQNTTVVLGLISTKTPKLENSKHIIQKIHQATKFIPLNRLAISTQCGFASVAQGNNLSFKDQQNKLHLVSKIAKKIWKG